MRRLRRWAVAIGLGMAVLATATWLTVSVMLRSAPSWWRQVRLDDAETQRIAREVENAVGTHLHLGREGGAREDGVWRSDAWSVSIRASDANAWLNARLPKWLESVNPGTRLPPGVGEVQVEFGEGRLSLGFSYAPGEGGEGEEKIVWLAARPALEPDGRLSLGLDGVYVGRLPIARAVLAELVQRVGGSWNAETREAATTLLGGGAIRVEPVVRLEDGRVVRLVGVRAREGRLELTCVTEHAPG